jgi:hypothetical protein
MVYKRFKKQNLSLDNFKDPADIQRVINSLQTNISDSIDPIVSKIQNDSQILTNITLIANQNNIINTTLSRTLAGWYVIRLRGQAIVWDNQDNNKSPNLTLWLNTSANVIVDLLVF